MLKVYISLWTLTVNPDNGFDLNMSRIKGKLQTISPQKSPYKNIGPAASTTLSITWETIGRGIPNHSLCWFILIDVQKLWWDRNLNWIWPYKLVPLGFISVTPYTTPYPVRQDIQRHSVRFVVTLGPEEAQIVHKLQGQVVPLWVAHWTVLCPNCFILTVSGLICKLTRYFQKKNNFF